MQGDEIKPENGGSQDPLSPVPEFDDPQYIPFSATLTKEVLAAAAAAAATATQESLLVPVLCLPCRTAGVHVSLYARKYPEKHKNGLSEDGKWSSGGGGDGGGGGGGDGGGGGNGDGDGDGGGSDGGGSDGGDLACIWLSPSTVHYLEVGHEGNRFRDYCVVG